MADEIYRPPFSEAENKREIDRMAGTPDSPGTGFGSKDAEAYVDNILTAMGFGNTDQRITNNLRAFNIIQNQANHQVQVENMGYVFFTRPSLNLSYDNIATVRKMTPMLTTDKESVWRFVRASLDHVGSVYRGGGADSPFVDPLNPFIPILTNSIETLGGWPNPAVDTYTSKAGNYKEQWAMADGSYHLYGAFNLNASFNNPPNDAVSKMLNTWTMYQSLVYDGTIAAYPQPRIQRYIDYQTRIYRFVMDHSKRKILKWANCGVAFPTTNTDADSMDFDRSKVYNENLGRIDQNFMCTGAEYNDPITLYEFNATVEIMNPSMRGGEEKRKQRMVKLSQSDKMYMNFLAYPYINLATNELEWWAFKNVYDYIKGRLGELRYGNNILEYSEFR